MGEKLKILAAGDIHGDKDIAKKLAKKAEKEKVDLVVLAGDIHGLFDGDDVIEPFEKKGKKVVFVPGNWDTKQEVEILRSTHSAKNLDNYYVTYGGHQILGVGGDEWKPFMDEERTLKELKKNFQRVRGKDGKKILVSHIHAEGTSAEFSGLEGSKVLREAIEKFQPDIFISAHIHEAEGLVDKIGKTKVYQVGRRGRIIEV
jgi:Icc-related predicted phosphoesterase